MKKFVRVLIITFLVAIIALAVFEYIALREPRFNILPKIKSQARESANDRSQFVQIKEGVIELHLKGTPYIRGYIHGAILKSQIRKLSKILNAMMLAKGKFIPYLGKSIAVSRAKKFIPFIPERYLLEMKGVADGSGVSYWDVFLANIFDDLLYVKNCSSLGLEKGIHSQNWYHARNLDYFMPFLARYHIIFIYESGKTHFLSVAFPAYIGVLTGFNQWGISLSSHTSICSDNALGIPSGLLYRKIMEKAHDLSDAFNILRKNNRTIGNNILIGSYLENSFLGVELSAHYISKRYPEEGTITMTNHFQCDKMKRLQRNPVFLKKSSHVRNLILERFLTSLQKPATLQDVINWFQSKKGKGLLFPSIANKGTVQSVIFDPANNMYLVAKGKNTPVTEAGYVTFSFPFEIKRREGNSKQ